MTEAPKNDKDAARLDQMTSLIGAGNALEFLRMAYKLGLAQGRIEGMQQSMDAMVADRAAT